MAVFALVFRAETQVDSFRDRPLAFRTVGKVAGQAATSGEYGLETMNGPAVEAASIATHVSRRAEPKSISIDTQENNGCRETSSEHSKLGCGMLGGE